MQILILFVLLLSCSSIAQLAKARGLKPFAWVLATVFSFFMGVFVASALLSMVMLFKNPALLPIIQNKDRAALNAFINQNLSTNLYLYSALIFAGAFGGYLLVRYILEKRK